MQDSPYSLLTRTRITPPTQAQPSQNHEAQQHRYHFHPRPPRRGTSVSHAQAQRQALCGGRQERFLQRQGLDGRHGGDRCKPHGEFRGRESHTSCLFRGVPCLKSHATTLDAMIGCSSQWGGGRFDIRLAQRKRGSPAGWWGADLAFDVSGLEQALHLQD